MKLDIRLFDATEMHKSNYESDIMQVELMLRSQVDHFVTWWYELSEDDKRLYACMYLHYTYIKIQLEGKLIYSGSPLTEDELQSKLKHITRQDVRIEKGE